MKQLKIFLLLFILLSGTNILAQKMNEIYSRGTTADPDWIEIYNPGSASVDISGFKIYDIGGQSGTKPKKEFPAGTVIPAYGYFVIVTDDTSASGFGLSSSGETVWLENAAGTVIDSVLFAAMATTESYGRAPDGGAWKLLSTITRGKTNIVVTDVLLPQFIQGLNGTNNTRVPYVFRLKISNLAANTTYRYINQIVTYTDAATTSGAGNVIFVNADNSFFRTTGPTFATPGLYGELTTDSTGSWSGWFITEPTGNARFTPGNYIRMRVRMNDGANGTLAVNWATSNDSVKVVNFGTTADPNQCTGIYGRTVLADAKDFIFLYDNVEGTGRPLSSGIIEIDSVNLNLTTTAQFYRDSVENIAGAWGSIVPNVLPTGVRRIERRVRLDGSIFPQVATDADGIWPSGANTVNPLGGLTAIRIAAGDAPVPVELVSFGASVNDGKVTLSWSTATETNNKGFEVQRLNGGLFETIGFVNGNSTSTIRNNYSFVDVNAVSGKQVYRLKQIDLDGTAHYSNTVEVDITAPAEFSLAQNYPNPFNPSTVINYQLAAKSSVTLKVYDVMGNEVASLVNENQDAGSYSVKFNASGLASGIYFYQLTAGEFTAVRKLNLMK